MRHTYAQKLASLNRLQRLCLPGPVLYSLIRNVSKTRLSLTVDFLTISDNRPWFLSPNIAVILDAQTNSKGQLILTDSEGRDPLDMAVRDLLVRLGELGMDTTDIRHARL
jgi:hypothetical protein